MFFILSLLLKSLTIKLAVTKHNEACIRTQKSQRIHDKITSASDSSVTPDNTIALICFFIFQCAYCYDEKLLQRPGKRTNNFSRNAFLCSILHSETNNKKWKWCLGRRVFSGNGVDAKIGSKLCMENSFFSTSRWCRLIEKLLVFVLLRISHIKDLTRFASLPMVLHFGKWEMYCTVMQVHTELFFFDICFFSENSIVGTMNFSEKM